MRLSSIRTLLRSFSVCSLLYGCSDPISPEFNNTHDGSSARYVPAAPSQMRVSQIKESTRLVEWQRNSVAETGYRVERKMGVQGAYGLLALLPAGLTSFVDTTTIRTDTNYTYRILAYAATGAVGAFDSITFRLPFPVPFGLHVTSQSGKYVHFAWADTSTIQDGFVLSRKTRGSDFQDVGIVPADSMGCTDSQLDTTQDYEYRVRAYTKNNTSGFSNTIGAMYMPAAVQAELQKEIGLPLFTVSKEGSLILSCTFTGPYSSPSSSIFDLLSNRVIWSTQSYSCFAAVFSGDNRVLAAYSGDGLIRVIRVSDGNQLQAIPVPANGDDYEMAMSDDGTIVACSVNNSLYCWRAQDGSGLFVTPPRADIISSIDISFDNHTIACGTGAVVELWDVSSGSLAFTLSPGQGPISSVQYGPNNLLAVMANTVLEFWDISTRSLKSSVPGDWQRQEGAFDFSGLHFIGDYLQPGSGIPVVGVWRISDGVLLQYLPYAAAQGPFWIGVPRRFPEHNVVETMDPNGGVFYSILSYVWGQHDW